MFSIRDITIAARLFISLYMLAMMALPVCWAEDVAGDMPASGALDINALIAQGRDMVSKGDIAGAMVLYESVIAREPTNARVLFELALLNLRTGAIDKGLAYFERSVAAAPDNMQLRLRLGQAYEISNRLSQASGEYALIIERAPGTPEAEEARRRIQALESKESAQGRVEQQLAQGRELVKQGKPQEALNLFEAILAQDPQNAVALYEAASIYLQRNEHEKGFDYFRRSVQAAPNNVRLRLNLAQAYEWANRREEAVKEYGHVINIAPESPEGRQAAIKLQNLQKTIGSEQVEGEESITSFLKRARELVANKEIAAAIAVYEEALVAEPRNAQFLYEASSLYFQQNDLTKGFDYLNRSVEAAPDNLRLRMKLAQTYEWANIHDRALAEYERIAAMAPNAQEGRESIKKVNMYKARNNALKGNIEEAVSQFLRILEEYPGDEQVIGEAGVVLLMANQLAKAREILEQGVEQQPSSGSLNRYLAEALERMGETGKAVSHYERAIELLPSDSAYSLYSRVHLGIIKGLEALKDGDNVLAEQKFQDVLLVDPENEIARINLAVAYRNLGKKTEAEQELRKILEVWPGNMEARIYLGALYQELGKPYEAAVELEKVMSQDVGSPQANQASRLLSSIYGGPSGKELEAKVLADRIKQNQEVLLNDPENVAAHIDLALIYGRQAKRANARIEFEEVLRIDPDNTQALMSLGVMHEEAGKLDSALELYSRAASLEARPDRSNFLRDQIRMVAAKKAYNEKRLEYAEAQFREIVEENPDNYMAHYYLAQIYTGKKEYEAVVSEYKEVIRAAPGHYLSYLNLGLVLEQLERGEEALGVYRSALRIRSPDGGKAAKQQLENLQKRLGGFSFGLTYAMGYDNNSNLSDEDPIEEIRTDMGGTIGFHHKLRGRSLTWGLNFAPTYSVYHQGQYDFLRMTLTPTLSWSARGYDFSARYNYSVLEGILNELRVSSSQNGAMDISRRFEMPAILGFFVDDEMKKKSPTFVRFGGGYGVFKSDSTPIYDANNINLTGSISQGLGDGASWVASYTYSNNGNTNEIGNDFAFNSHAISLQYSKVLTPRLSTSASYGYSYTAYIHPDSVTQFETKRINHGNTLTGSANYSINDKLRAFASYSFDINDSNLPTGLILSPEDIGVAVGLQSPSLGDYMKHQLNMGIALEF